MTELLNASFSTTNEGAVLTLSVAENRIPQDQLQVQLALHDDIAVAWCASFSCEKQGTVWVGRLPGWGAIPSSRLVELMQLQDAYGTVLNFERPVLFLEPSGEGEWITGVAAKAESERLRAMREARFNVPLLAPNTSETDPHFAIVMLVENLLLSGIQRVPGMEVLPLSQTNLGNDEVEVLNAVLQQLGFGSPLNSKNWIKLMRQQRPAAALYVRRCRAPDPNSAIAVGRRTAHQLLDLLALRRGAAPRLLGGAVGTLDASNVPQGEYFWIEGGGYSGNLAGGLGAGEDLHGLLLFWEGLSKEPRVRLWLSLYADAIADERWDYQLFRCFNLLEGIASEVVPKRVHVLDDQGNTRLQINGRPYTTEEARGKVYELLRSVAKIANYAESSFTSRHSGNISVELWDEIGLWLIVRNAVAHRGSWQLPEGDDPSIERLEVIAEFAARGHDGTFEAGIRPVIRAVQESAKCALIAALRGKLSYVHRTMRTKP